MALYNKVIERVTEDKEEDTRPRLLSSEFDTISEGIGNAWNALPESVKESATNTANFIRNVFIDDPGSEWNQAILKKVLTNVEGEEVGLQKFNALNESIARGDHDPIGKVFGAAIEGVSQIPTAVGLPPLDTRATRTGLALYTLGKTPLIPRKSNLYGYGQRFRNVPASKRIINVNAEAIDSIFKMPPAEFQAIIRLAKDSGINSLDLARRFNEQQGILKTYLQSKGRYGPLEDTRDLKGMATAGGYQSPEAEFGPDPRIRWDTTEGKEQARLFRDQFTEATLIKDGASTKNPLVYKPEVKVSDRGVPISKRKEAGYKFLGDFAKEWNTWSTDVQFIDELADAPGKAFVEHLVGKGDRLNWFWNLPNEVRFRKGSRHGPDNVRLFYSDRQKKLKDATENILYKMQEGMNPRKRLIVEYDIPKMEGKSITVRQPAGDVIIRKVDGTEVGRLGDYFDVLYARTPILEEALTTNINPRTGTFYIDPNTRDMKKAIRYWRENIIREKLNKIIDEAPNIEGKTASEIYQEKAGEIIDKDLADFNAEYSFIPKPKGSTLDATMTATSFEGPPPDIKKLLGINPTPEMTTFLKENNQGLDMLIDRIRGSSWNQLKKNYKGYNQKKVEKVLSQLTSNDIEKIRKAYGISGKGALTEEGKFKVINDIINLRKDKFW